jgi:hypothetical protein
MCRDRIPRRKRDVPSPPPPEPETAETNKPLYRLVLSDNVGESLRRNIAVHIDVCASGEPCESANHCGNQAHVKVIARGGELRARIWCADHWLAVREFYAALSADFSSRRGTHGTDGRAPSHRASRVPRRFREHRQNVGHPGTRSHTSSEPSDGYVAGGRADSQVGGVGAGEDVSHLHSGG